MIRVKNIAVHILPLTIVLLLATSDGTAASFQSSGSSKSSVAVLPYLNLSDTAEDEYHYELDRNETHRMLLTVLLKDKLDNDYIRAKVEAFVDTADKHRAVADDMAGRKRFDMAIQELERSTAEIVKAIRGAGVYIPG